MAVKVVYDATRGLVQENDTTGAGGFVIKDAILSEGVEGTAANPIEAGAGPAGTALSITHGISLVETTVGQGAGVVTVPNADPANIGQIKTVVYKTEAAGGDSLTVKGTGFSSATLSAAGDVLVLMWTGTAWNIVGQTS